QNDAPRQSFCNFDQVVDFADVRSDCVLDASLLSINTSRTMSDFEMLLSVLPPPPTFPPAPRRALCTTVRISPHHIIVPRLNDLASFHQASAVNLHAMSIQNARWRPQGGYCESESRLVLSISPLRPGRVGGRVEVTLWSVGEDGNGVQDTSFAPSPKREHYGTNGNFFSIQLAHPQNLSGVEVVALAESLLSTSVVDSPTPFRFLEPEEPVPVPPTPPNPLFPLPPVIQAPGPAEQISPPPPPPPPSPPKVPEEPRARNPPSAQETWIIANASFIARLSSYAGASTSIFCGYFLRVHNGSEEYDFTTRQGLRIRRGLPQVLALNAGE
ncbi:hypothetical protein B0H13DRAFT_2488337, partial [Mycena leptocephala]